MAKETGSQPSELGGIARPHGIEQRTEEDALISIEPGLSVAHYRGKSCAHRLLTSRPYYFSASLILLLYSRGLSKRDGLVLHMPRFFALATASAALYRSSKPPNSAPVFASYVVARPRFSI